MINKMVRSYMKKLSVSKIFLDNEFLQAKYRCNVTTTESSCVQLRPYRF